MSTDDDSPFGPMDDASEAISFAMDRATIWQGAHKVMADRYDNPKPADVLNLAEFLAGDNLPPDTPDWGPYPEDEPAEEDDTEEDAEDESDAAE